MSDFVVTVERTERAKYVVRDCADVKEAISKMDDFIQNESGRVYDHLGADPYAHIMVGIPHLLPKGANPLLTLAAPDEDVVLIDDKGERHA